MSLFRIFVKCESMKFLAIFKIFIGTQSGPTTFPGFKDLIILFISSAFDVGKSK